MNIIDFPLQARAEEREKQKIINYATHYYRDLFLCEDEDLLDYDIVIAPDAEISNCQNGYWIDAQIWVPK
tara:strand:+ start:3931 stop:4140 length:210 start_codon:yes stop_codon:yes gene_type:complete